MNIQNLHTDLEARRSGTGNKVVIGTRSSEVDGFPREDESQQLGINYIQAVSGKGP